MKIKICSELRTLRTLSLSKWSKCRTIILLSLCLWNLNISAQTTPVNILDFIILPVPSTISQSDSVMLNIMFKTDSAVIANKAIILFGTSDDASDVKYLEAGFTNHNDTSYITYSGNTMPIINFATYITVKLSQQQYNTYSRATLFVEDTNGLQTEHLYLQKH